MILCSNLKYNIVLTKNFKNFLNIFTSDEFICVDKIYTYVPEIKNMIIIRAQKQMRKANIFLTNFQNYCSDFYCL